MFNYFILICKIFSNNIEKFQLFKNYLEILVSENFWKCFVTCLSQQLIFVSSPNYKSLFTSAKKPFNLHISKRFFHHRHVISLFFISAACLCSVSKWKILDGAINNTCNYNELNCFFWKHHFVLLLPFCAFFTALFCLEQPFFEIIEALADFPWYKKHLSSHFHLILTNGVDRSYFFYSSLSFIAILTYIFRTFSYIDTVCSKFNFIRFMILMLCDVNGMKNSRSYNVFLFANASSTRWCEREFFT